jgi:hypothetical protein
MTLLLDSVAAVVTGLDSDLTVAAPFASPADLP